MPDLLDAEGEELPPPPHCSNKKCLMCTRKFRSNNKFNRLCKKCNGKIDTKGFGGKRFDEHIEM